MPKDETGKKKQPLSWQPIVNKSSLARRRRFHIKDKQREISQVADGEPPFTYRNFR